MRMLIIPFAVILFTLTGCDSVVDDNSVYDYSIEQNIGCLYCPQNGEWIKLFIKADTVAAAYRISDNYQLSYNEIRNFKSIKGLSDEIAARDTNEYIVRVEYNSENNYPSYLYMEPKPVIVNDTTTIIRYDTQIVYYTQNYIKLK